MTAATPKQRNVLRHVDRLTKLHGYAPSLRELADRIGVNTNTVRDHLQALKRKGLLDITPRVARSYTVTEAGRAVLDGGSDV